MVRFEGSDFAVVAVVAVARNGVIGHEGAMPWHLPGDLKRYRRLTMGRPMIMGRRTLVSIGRVLDGRDTIVLTRGAVSPIEGAILARTPDEALELAAQAAVRRGANEIVIAGGAEIYALFLDRTDRIEMTVVEAEPEGDTRFPPLDPVRWLRGEPEPAPADPRDSAAATFVRWTHR